jgi:hypothetical protein
MLAVEQMALQGNEGVVSCMDSRGGVKGVVEGSVVKVENIGGETNCFS